MPAEIKTELIKLGSDLVSHVVKLGIHRAINGPPVPKQEAAEEIARDKARESAKTQAIAHSIPVPNTELQMPTTEETVAALKQRLASELYRVELDLQGGARIANKPCDCLGRNKHGGELLAVSGELMSYEKNAVYGEISSWYETHEREFQPAEIVKHDLAHYQSMAPTVRDFRKRLGITSPTMKPIKGKVITLEQAKKLAADEAAKEVERVWKSQRSK